MKKTVIYQMLPRLWGEGRMSSVDDATLTYLKKLGVSHVWYTGIIRHSSGKDFVKGDPGSPYAICDYYDLNAYLADNKEQRMNEFSSLVERTHSYGMKVLIDFVPNHVGRDYSDSFGGIPHFEYSDYDWTDTYKINYGHPDTWQTMKNIVRYWASRGVDGFRCDMVEMVPPEFFKWLIAEIKAEFPEIIFVAEVYQKDRYRQYIKDVGFDFLYDKSGLYDVLRGIAGGYGSARGISWNWQFLGDLQPHMLNFLENHDEQRIASPWFTGRSENAPYLYASMMLNTAPFMLYFGQEVGITASEGHEGRTSIFSWCKPEELDDLWKHVHGTGKLSREEAATLRLYSRALALSAKDAIGGGLTYDLCYCQNEADGFDFDRNFVFIRKSIAKTNRLKHRTFLFFLDFSDFGTKCGTDMPKKVHITIPEHALSYLGLELSQERMEQGMDIETDACGCTVIEL